jgi:hypothetical protein
MEMLERFARSDDGSMPARLFARATRHASDHDLERIRAAMSDDFVLQDHRRAGLGRLDGAGYVASLVALFELAPDVTVEILYILAGETHGMLSIARNFGTLAEGGEFETVYVLLIRSERDRFVGVEMFELDDLDVARARFAELRPDPLRIPPNAATRASDRLQEAGRAQDWDALRALCAPELELDDRRRGLRMTGDREMYVASMRHVFSGRARAARTVLATSGDRLALERVLWTGPEDASLFEIETLSIWEVDAEGHVVARIIFDPDERRAASAELFERYVRSDAGRWMPSRAIELRRAVHDRDLDRIRAVVSDNVVFDDHRRTGPGRVEDTDGFVAWIAALFEQSPDAIIEPLYYVATGKHGYVAVAHTFGTLIDGGAFETVFARLMLYQGDRIIMECSSSTTSTSHWRASRSCGQTPSASHPTPHVARAPA